MLFIQTVILISLGLICYQDMRYRAVYWICFPILALSLVFLKKCNVGISTIIADMGYEFIFLGIQLFLLWIYFSLKNRKLINITNNYLGLGDILFLVAITFYLSPANYLFFYILSLIVVLIYTLILQMIKRNTNPEIPLAGLQALLFCIFLIASIINPNLKPYSDLWVYGL